MLLKSDEKDSAKLPQGFRCQNSMVEHLEKVFAGCYDFDVEEPSIVLDIGANCGAFTLHARELWPNARVIGYEPCTANFAFLVKNVGATDMHKVAVSTIGEYAFLRYGKWNMGESSLYGDTESNIVNGEAVKCLHPKDLPPADFIKIDTEGAEADILMYYPHLDKVKGVTLEWHRANDVPGIIELCQKGAGLKLISADPKERILKFKRNG